MRIYKNGLIGERVGDERIDSFDKFLITQTAARQCERIFETLFLVFDSPRRPCDESQIILDFLRPRHLAARAARLRAARRSRRDSGLMQTLDVIGIIGKPFDRRRQFACQLRIRRPEIPDALRRFENVSFPVAHKISPQFKLSTITVIRQITNRFRLIPMRFA